MCTSSWRNARSCVHYCYYQAIRPQVPIRGDKVRWWANAEVPTRERTRSAKVHSRPVHGNSHFRRKGRRQRRSGGDGLQNSTVWHSSCMPAVSGGKWNTARNIYVWSLPEMQAVKCSPPMCLPASPHLWHSANTDRRATQRGRQNICVCTSLIGHIHSGNHGHGQEPATTIITEEARLWSSRRSYVFPITLWMASQTLHLLLLTDDPFPLYVYVSRIC